MTFTSRFCIFAWTTTDWTVLERGSTAQGNSGQWLVVRKKTGTQDCFTRRLGERKKQQNKSSEMHLSKCAECTHGLSFIYMCSYD